MLDKKYSLSDLQDLIKGSIENTFTNDYWISAEISEININPSGHCYLELIEKHTGNDNITARARAIIWARQMRFLLPYFETSTGQTLSSGIKVLVKVVVEYHKVYGLSLVINDIDPAYTLGEIALQRAMIIKRLEKEGIMHMNNDLEFPILPRSIAIISSGKAAGYQDFVKHLKNNSYGYGYRVKLFPSLMQGEETESSVIAALNSIHESIGDFDIVVIARGGGSVSDLSWFDNYNIAFMITQFPIPVLTGIGHEKDQTITDMVSNMSFKTPTAVADYIIEQSFTTEQYLNELSESIRDSTMTIINFGKEKLVSARLRIVPLVRGRLSFINEELLRYGYKLTNSSRIHIGKQKEGIRSLKSDLISTIIHSNARRIAMIEAMAETLKNQISRYIKEKWNSITMYDKSVEHLSPQEVLKRGYSITRKNGKAVRFTSELQPGDKISSTLSNGDIESQVFEIKK